MNIEAHVPAELLRPFIKHYLIIESQDELVNRVLPDTSPAIAFRLKGQINYIKNNNFNKLPTSAISGLRKSVRLIQYYKDTATIIVQFREAAASFLLKEDLHELFEKTVSLDNFLPRQKLLLLEEQLSEAKNNVQRIAIVNQFFLSGIQDFKPDGLIFAAIQKIRATNGLYKINDLAYVLNISQDAFEKRFRRIVGTSPKQFSSIIRMKSIIIDRKQKKRATEIAYDAGFFDQSHFNKDFRIFTGQTPTEFFKSSSLW